MMEKSYHTVNYLIFTPCFVSLLLWGIASKAQSGCTDPLANNYNASAAQNDGSCTYNTAIISPETSTQLNATLNETSGLILWDDTIWTHNDGGNDTNLYAIGVNDLANFSSLTIPEETAPNVDWEDIAQDENYVYIGDFGNNANGNRTDLKIYRISKSSIVSSSPAVDVINFDYEDQTDFTPTEINKTDFDCEAIIATDSNLFLFTKQWLSQETTVYALPKVPGTYSATNEGSFDVNGLITGATYMFDKQLIALSGYQFLNIYGLNIPFPFIYLLYDFQNDDFFGGNKRRLSFSVNYPQIEGITSSDGLNYYISNERSSNSFVTVEPHIHKVNLNSYLLDYLGYETSGNGTLFSEAASWTAGVVPPINENISIAHDLHLDQDYTAGSVFIKSNSILTIQPEVLLKAKYIQVQDNSSITVMSSNSVTIIE